jgi:hypothetical protein
MVPFHLILSGYLNEGDLYAKNTNHAPRKYEKNFGFMGIYGI